MREETLLVVCLCLTCLLQLTEIEEDARLRKIASDVLNKMDIADVVLLGSDLFVFVLLLLIVAKIISFTMCAGD